MVWAEEEISWGSWLFVVRFVVPRVLTRVAREAYVLMRPAKRGAIVNMASLAAHTAGQWMGADYAASKAAADLLVLYDDLDLPLGRIRLRPAGGVGGHRGMADIADEIHRSQP